MEESKHKSSRKEELETKEESRKSHRKEREDRDSRERNGERHKDKDKDRDRDRHRYLSDKKKDRESRRTEREKSVHDEREKHKDRHREKDKDKERDKGKVKNRDDERFRDKDRLKEKDREREDIIEADREREKDKEREDREKEKEKEKEREKEKEKEKEREKEKRDRERERAREKEREREREKERVREREKERETERERQKERERERERERRDREREREREERERDKREREREEKDRERIREREKRRHLSSDDDEDVKERDRKRRRREDSRDRERERSSRLRRFREGSDDSGTRKRSEEDLSDKKEARTREEDLEEEQRKLDEEMEKRRRRVQEWQELKRKEESEREKLGVTENVGEPKSGKTWTLEGESDDEEAAAVEENSEMDTNLDEDVKPIAEVADGMVVDSANGNAAAEPEAQSRGDGDMEDEEIDPLDAFMNSMVLPEVEKLDNASVPSAPENKNADLKKEKKDKSNAEQRRNGNKATGRIIQGEDSDSDYGDIADDDNPSEDEDDDEFMKRVKKTKVEKLPIVDHSKIEYPSFRKNFYIEVKEISRMTSEEVRDYRQQLELKLHGKDVPKPIKTWYQIGLSTKILDTIKKLNYEKPMPIQSQALPVIMSGRDCIGIAKTGSGKTLAFVLPMLRHIKDQPPVVSGDGPIGLIMAPTRELVQQIHSDIKKFSKVMGLTCVPVYGGSGVAQQISELKRGAEIVVCTPGRMIDILCTSGGKITNLRRVTYLVMDEADRMFDMGFEPQITRIIQNTRPDRQTVLFSATFPRQVELLAKKVLNKPVEMQVGGRSVVNKDITQLVEVRPESDRFLRLLELLGEWYEKGKILIFVHTQDKCDSLFKDLLKHGYPCLSLHGAKDQTDRESTISDFKTNVCNLLVATSIAARGLDVKELELVINFDAPNHYEDYVHRVGRTGRAGRKGCAITFISEEDERYAPDLVKALELSEQVVPDDLKALADGFMAKWNQGLVQGHGTGYGGSGFKFNEEEDEVRRAAKKAQAKEYGFEEDKSDSDDEDDGVRKAGGDLSQQAVVAQAAALAAAAASKVSMASISAPISAPQLLPNGGIPLSLPSVLGPTVGSINPGDGAARAAALAAAMNLQHNLAKIQADALPEHYEAELEINEFPQNARWKVTHKETLGPISEWTGAAITTRGQFFPPGKVPGPGERKLYLFIEGPTEQSVKRAKSELKHVLEDITTQAVSLPGSAQPGRYSVL